MPTILTKPIRRQLLAPVTLMGRTKTLVIELEPGDMITFREKGKRVRYSCPLASVYVLALMEYIKEEHKAKAERHKAGKGRKPKPLNLSMFARHLQLALTK